MTFDTINDAQTIAGSGEGTLLANRYRVVRQLGQGGMGSEWLVEDTQLDNKPFAIKMLPSILVANKRAYRQLKDESLVAMKLTHPNIVTLRAFEENNGNPFLVMDYIDGQTLDDYLAEKGNLSEDEVLRVLRPIAVALDYAHSEGVVHRDVKPANVMIRKDGHPYILGFGVACEIQETMTRVTGRLSSGTLLYMSPEQLRGQSPKPAQDIYSFAAMAYKCLKGEPPFVRGQIEFQILNEQPESLEGRVAISAPLAASVMAGLAKKPEDRPPTCMGMLEGYISRGDAETQSAVVARLTEEKYGSPILVSSKEVALKHNKVQLWKDGPYWAETNIGAENPWDSGYYFWWGDTVGYKYENNIWVASDGSSSSFQFSEDNPICQQTYRKRNSVLRSEGWITADCVLAPEYDAAQVQWGGGWRMPTKQELDDLCDKCDWIWTTVNGVSGYVAHGRDGYVSANIFFPTAGLGHGASLNDAGSLGSYWSSSSDGDNYGSWRLYFRSHFHETAPNYCHCGFSVRPVQGIT